MPVATRASSSAPATISSTSGVCRVGPRRPSLGGIGDLAAVDQYDRDRETETHGREVGHDLVPGNRAEIANEPGLDLGLHEAQQLLPDARDRRTLRDLADALQHLARDEAEHDGGDVADA